MEEQSDNINHQADRLSRRIAVIALIISILAAGVALYQAYVSRDTEVRQLRAYLSIQPSQWRGLVDGSPLSMGFTLFNYGQTPAKEVNVTGEIEILPFPLPRGFVPHYDLIGGMTTNGVVFPNEDHPEGGWIPATRAFSPQEIQEITSPAAKVRAYVFARITYCDAFGNQRETLFCHFLDPASVVWSHDSIKTFIWAYADRFNDWN